MRESDSETTHSRSKIEWIPIGKSGDHTLCHNKYNKNEYSIQSWKALFEDNTMESDDLHKFTDKDTEAILKKSKDKQFEYITELSYGAGKKENVVVVFRINQEVRFLTKAAYNRNVPISKPKENDDNQVSSMSSVPTDNMSKREIGRVHAGAGSDQATGSNQDTDSQQRSTPKSKIERRSSPPRTSHKIWETIESTNGDSSTSEVEEEQRPKNKRLVYGSPHVSQRISGTPLPVQSVRAFKKGNSYSALEKEEAPARREKRQSPSPQRSFRSSGDESSDGSESLYIRNGISGETPEREEDGEIICGSTFTGKTKAIVQRGEAYDIEKVHECPVELLTHGKDSQGFSPEVDKLFFQCNARTIKSYTENFKMVGCAAKWHGYPKAWIFILIKVSNIDLQKSLNKSRKADGLKYRGLLICTLSTFKKVVKNYEGELEKAGELLTKSLLYTNCKPEDQKILSAKFIKGEAKRRKSKYVIELEEDKNKLQEDKKKLEEDKKGLKRELKQTKRMLQEMSI